VLAEPDPLPYPDPDADALPGGRGVAGAGGADGEGSLHGLQIVAHEQAPVVLIAVSPAQGQGFKQAQGKLSCNFLVDPPMENLS
jgi:hypothetical protein